VTSQTIIATILFLLVYFLRTRELPYLYIEEHSMQDLLKIPTALMLLAVCVLLVYGLHQDYRYPYILDEWQHLAQGIQIAENGGISLNNPYYKDGALEETGFLEVGFHILLAEIFLLTGQDPVLFYACLPAIFAGISALCAFMLAYKVTGNANCGLLSILFYAGLKSSVNILGPGFFVPLTLGFAYIYFILYLISEGLERGSQTRTGLAAFNLLALALIHPWSAAIILPITALYLLSRRELVTRKNVPGIAVLFIAFFLSFTYILCVLWQGDPIKTLERFIGKFLIRGLEIPVNEVADILFPAKFYGPVPFALALVALGYLILKIKYSSLKAGVLLLKSAELGIHPWPKRPRYSADFMIKEKKKERMLLAWTLLTAAIIALFQATSITVLAPYERIVYYALLSFVPLSAIGLITILDCINKRIKIGVISIAISVLLITAVAYSLYSGYYENREKLYRMIDDPGYDALLWLGNRGEHSVVLARPEISSAVYPIARDYVVSVSPAQLGVGLRGLEDNREFFASGCARKKEILDKYGADYVYVNRDDKVSCSFLRRIYSLKGFYIYEYIRNQDGNP